MTLGLLADRDRIDGRAASRGGLRSILHRLLAVSTSGSDDARSARARQLGQVCTVLEGARAVIERGWLQGGWYADARQPRSLAAVGAPKVRPPLVTQVTGACLVGAVVHATCQRDPTAGLIEAAPALDVVWDAWQESRGLGGPGVAGRAAPREVRAARVRDLIRWNDQPGRNRAEVLGLLDLAVSRAIMEAAGAPVAASLT